MTDVDVLELTVADVPPKVTLVGLARLVPEMTTEVEPLVGPDDTDRDVMVGGPTTATVSADRAEFEPAEF